MAIAARIAQAVLLLGAVIIGVLVIANASKAASDAEDYCFIRPGTDTPPASCAQLPRFQVQAISTGAMAVVGLSLMVGAVALNPYTRGTSPAAPAPAHPVPAAPWQPGPPTGPYGQPPRA